PAGKSYDGRWLRVEQRGQRQTVYPHTIPAYMGSTRSRGRRASYRRGTAHISLGPKTTSRLCYEAFLSWTRVFRGANRTCSEKCRSEIHEVRSWAAARDRCGENCARGRRRLVSRENGMGSSCAGEPLDSRASRPT